MRVLSSTKYQRFVLHRFVVVIFVVLVQVVIASAQTTTFTYQGRLTDGGTSANGMYDMQFKLFDTSNNQLGSTLTQNSVTVTNGVFTVMLDYGAATFSGNDRVLEIGIKPAGSGDPYTVLSPRQPVTSTPYAIRAANTTTADTAFNSNKLGGVNADQYVLTTDPRLAGSSANYIQNSNSQQAANFNISGNGNVAGFLSGNTVNTATQYNLEGLPFISAPGLNNTFIGRGTGQSFDPSSQGQYNTLVGRSAGLQLSTGSENTFVGFKAGSSITSNGGNSLFGYQSGINLTGDRNAFFGENTGLMSTANHQNSFFGSNAGRNNKSERNSFFGEQAGRDTVAGMENSFYGASAGLKNVDGQDNSFFGYSAGESNTTANNNAFFGVRAGEKNTTGADNAFFGYHAGHNNITASDNAYFGTYAGASGTGSSNAMFGNRAGLKTTTGFANAFVGYRAGELNEAGFNHAFFGRGAGAANVGGNNNTIVGAFADVLSPNLMFATAIGSGATVNSSNTIVIGRGNGSDAVVVPGSLAFGVLGAGGNGTVCRNVLGQLAACSSSLRYKKDLAPFRGGLALLHSLKPITFTWKSDNSKDLGFGAEDVAAVEPLLVVHNEMGQVEGVKYDRITAVLVNAVKEQQAQISQQQQLVQSQQQQIARQQQMLQSQQHQIEKLKTVVCRRKRCS